MILVMSRVPTDSITRCAQERTTARSTATGPRDTASPFGCAAPVPELVEGEPACLELSEGSKRRARSRRQIAAKVLGKVSEKRFLLYSCLEGLARGWASAPLTVKLPVRALAPQLRGSARWQLRSRRRSAGHSPPSPPAARERQ